MRVSSRSRTKVFGRWNGDLRAYSDEGVGVREEVNGGGVSDPEWSLESCSLVATEVSVCDLCPAGGIGGCKGDRWFASLDEGDFSDSKCSETLSSAPSRSWDLDREVQAAQNTFQASTRTRAINERRGAASRTTFSGGSGSETCWRVMVNAGDECDLRGGL